MFYYHNNNEQVVSGIINRTLKMKIHSDFRFVFSYIRKSIGKFSISIREKEFFFFCKFWLFIINHKNHKEFVKFYTILWGLAKTWTWARTRSASFSVLVPTATTTPYYNCHFLRCVHFFNYVQYFNFFCKIYFYSTSSSSCRCSSLIARYC